MDNRIVIVDDNIEICESLRLLIENLSEYNVVNTYHDCQSALDNLKKDNPDIVLMDISLPRTDGVKCTNNLKRLFPDVQVLITTVSDQLEDIERSFRSGASGYVTKTFGYKRIIEAIDEVISGDTALSKDVANILVKSYHRNEQSPLTAREAEILEMVSMGSSNAIIADELFISLETVKSHIGNILEKLRVKNRVEAVHIARSSGYI